MKESNKESKCADGPNGRVRGAAAAKYVKDSKDVKREAGGGGDAQCGEAG